ncbi:MAG: hypothetical protein IPL92_19755 [Saprospiraceae bacterium]|nr:hypothetical protein [Candidatus Opimibacter iunctus]
MDSDTATYTAEPEHIISPVTLWWRRFFIRLRSWEYWPLYVFNIPVLGMWIWNAIKARDFFFFTLTNPGIPTGGFFGESKSAILHHIPDAFKPKTVLLKAPVATADIPHIFEQSGLTFPVIAKPEVGERGWLISRINSMAELLQYISDHPIDIILQTYVELPLEVSIMVYSMPDGTESAVTSICEKHFLQVKGDGKTTLGQLIMQQDRAVLQYEKLRDKFGARWNEVLSPGEVLILEPVGNHCRGTMFLNRNVEIDEAIRGHMVSLLRTMPGVYYGRFDMRIGSWEALRAGREIRVLEFNGTSADPAHIYQPGYSLWKAYMDMAFHWNVMYRIARQNKRLGNAPDTFKSIISALIIYFRYKRTN